MLSIDLECHSEPVRRESIDDRLTPLDDHGTFGTIVHEFEIIELRQAGEPIHVNMYQRKEPVRIGSSDHERGTRDTAADTEAFGDAGHEKRFTCSQTAGKHDDVARRQKRRKPTSERFGLVRRSCGDSDRHC